MVYAVLNKHDFEQELEEAGDRLVVIDFFANWCGPCKIIEPQLQELSLQYAGKAKFLKVNVDDCEDIAMAYNITSMPTFVFKKHQQVIDILVGSNTENLAKRIEKYVGEEQKIIKKLKTANQETEGTLSNHEYNIEHDDLDDYDLQPHSSSVLEVTVDDEV